VLTQISHNRIGQIKLTPLDVEQCARTALCLRSTHTADLFLGNIHVQEYGSMDGSLFEYAYRFGPAVTLKQTHVVESLFMLLMVEGSLVLQQGLGEDCTIAEGIVCVFRSREYQISLAEQCTVRYLLFDIGPLAELLNLQGFEPGRYRLTNILQAQLFEVQHPPAKLAEPEQWLSGQMIGMLYQLKESISLGLRLPSKIFHQDFALAADVFIQRNLLQDHTTKEIARYVGLNDCDLKKAFEKYYGTGMAKRQNFLRIERAKQLLQQTDKAIQDIAIACGYNCTRTLNNNFLRETKFTPLEWRKKYSI